MLMGGALAGCVLLANSAFVQASLLWITLTPVIFKFNRYCKLRFGEARYALHPLANQCSSACSLACSSEKHVLLWLRVSHQSRHSVSARSLNVRKHCNNSGGCRTATRCQQPNTLNSKILLGRRCATSRWRWPRARQRRTWTRSSTRRPRCGSAAPAGTPALARPGRTGACRSTVHEAQVTRAAWANCLAVQMQCCCPVQIYTEQGLWQNWWRLACCEPGSMAIVPSDVVDSRTCEW